ncbi:MAG TPA: hypothetical protein VGI39_16900 [Polyangiaceae bacterium]
MNRENRLLLVDAHMAQVAKVLRRRALLGTFNGHASGQLYINNCRRICGELRTVIIFTRDTGHHTSGWMKNPDYERCWHLSLSPMPDQIVVPGTVTPLGELDKDTRARWVRAFYGDDARFTWFESAKSPEGKARHVEHFRLFCDEHWKPKLPRGEVYSMELTALGWRSASQVLEEDGREIVSTMDPT